MGNNSIRDNITKAQIRIFIHCNKITMIFRLKMISNCGIIALFLPLKSKSEESKFNFNDGFAY